MSVKVAVRVRPFNSREKGLGCQCVVDMQDPTTILKPFHGQQQRKFTFDYSFWSFDGFETQADGYMKATGDKYADQKVVFEKIGKKILDNAWEGYHCCLFAYGQTGSGKSYSMIGYGTNKGIVPITCNEIFERMKNKQAGVEYEVSASMLQIYNQEVQDLTVPIKDRVSGGLKIRQNKLLGVYVDGVKKHTVTTYAEVENVMDMGTKNRTVAATQMNATSSRAHTIITVEFRQVKKIGQKKSEKVSMINLVDLAGSQRQDKTGATGQRFKQAVGINQSLTCLGQVITILAKNAEGGKQFVPYRNSALTRILQNALGGNSQTIMICAISPANDNYDESLSTLRYADQAKKIKNKPVVNQSQTDKLIRSLKQQNQRLKKLVEGKGTGIPTQIDPAKLQQIKKKQEQAKRKEQQFKKKEQQIMKKQQQQSQKLKKLQDELFKKQLQKQQIDKKKKQEADEFQKKLQAAQADDQEFEKLKKQMQAKKKQDQEKEKKMAEERQQLQLKQKQQTKILQQQQQQLQKAQQEYKKLQQQMQKKAKHDQQQRKKAAQKQKPKNEEKKQNEDKKPINHVDEEEIQANINRVNQALNQLKLSQQQIKKQAAKDQEQLKKKNEDQTILSKKGLQQKEKKDKTLPPYLQNISKDVMINRKMKLILQKNVLHVGKAGCNPPNDIIFGGRDVNPRHATIHIIDQKVFLKPISKQSHLYVNGKNVTETIQLVNLDRVIFGWNSCYLFKNKHDDRNDEKINDKDINWDFVRDEVAKLVDIDQSDTQDGGGCCSIF